MSTTSRQHLYGSTIRASAERAKKARKEADRPAYEAWNFRMLGYKGPAQPSPTIGDALNAGYSHALPVSTSKSDRLPWPPPAKPEPAIKPAEPIDYAQADAEVEKKVRRAHAEAPDLCQRHGMHKVWTKDGKSWRCRRRDHPRPRQAGRDPGRAKVPLEAPTPQSIARSTLGTQKDQIPASIVDRRVDRLPMTFHEHAIRISNVVTLDDHACGRPACPTCCSIRGLAFGSLMSTPPTWRRPSQRVNIGR